MPKYINADTLYQSFGATGNCNNCPLDAYKCQYYNEHTLMEFCERIDDAPIVDAVEVIRCKNCKHYYADPWGYGNCVFEGGVSRRTKDSDFCSWGEWKEDEERSF